MDEETYRKEIISLEVKLHQVYDEYWKKRDLFNRLQVLIGELRALSIESHNHLNSQIAKCKNWTEINILIQQEYPAWLHDRIVIVNRRLQHIFEESDISYLPDDFNSIIDIADSIKYKLKSVLPNRNLMCANEDGTLDDFIRQIDNLTIASIDKIQSFQSEKIRIMEECLMSTEQLVRKLEHDIVWLKYDLQKHAQSNYVVASERKGIDKPVSYSSVNITDFKSNKNPKSQTYIDKDKKVKEEKEPNGSAILGCALGRASISNLILGSACSVAGSILGVGMGVMKRLHNFKDSKKLTMT